MSTPPVEMGAGLVAAGPRPRLLVLASTFPSGEHDGTPGFVRALAEREAARFDTLVLVPRTSGAAGEQDLGAGLRVRRFRYFPRRWEDLADGAILDNLRARRWRLVQVPAFLLAEAAAVRRAVREFDPDVLHVHWIVPQGLVALAAARGRPWLVTTHGGDLYALRGPAWRAVKRAVLRRASAVTGVNADMVDRLLRLGAPPDRTQALPMGADVDRVRAAAARSTREPGRIVFVGRLVEKKGVAVLLDALRRLAPGRAGPAWSLSVVGDGPLRAELERAAAGLPVTFHGMCPPGQVAELLGAAEVFALPSLPARSGDQDGLPVALLEAMAAGVAVVASRIPGVADAVRDQRDGVLVPPGDPAALAAALADLLADPGRRAWLGASASARADEYSADALGARYASLLAELVAARPQTGVRAGGA